MYSIKYMSRTFPNNTFELSHDHVFSGQIYRKNVSG